MIKASVYPFIYATPERIEGRPVICISLREVFWSRNYGSDITPEAIQVANWLRLNTTAGEGFHEPNGGVLEVGENNSRQANPLQRFYFTRPTAATAFKETFADFNFRHQMQPSLRSVDLKSGSSFELAGMLGYSAPSITTEQGIAFWCWCEDNLKGRMLHEPGMLIFTDADDLILFKMTFCGPPHDKSPFTFDLVNMPYEVLQ